MIEEHSTNIEIIHKTGKRDLINLSVGFYKLISLFATERVLVYINGVNIYISL